MTKKRKAVVKAWIVTSDEDSLTGTVFEDPTLAMSEANCNKQHGGHGRHHVIPVKIIREVER